MNLQHVLNGYELSFNTAQNSVESVIKTNYSTMSGFNSFIALFCIAVLYFFLKSIKPVEVKVHLLVALKSITRLCKNIVRQRILSAMINEAVPAAAEYDPSVCKRRMQLHYVLNASSETVSTSPRKVHVKLRHNNNEDINFVHAAAMYVERGFMPNGKTILHPAFARACNLVMVRKIVEKANNRCREYFLGPYFNEYVGNDQEVFNLYCDLLEADKRGIFIPVLVSQAERIASMLEYVERDFQLIKDFQQLIRRLHQVVTSNNTHVINTSVFNRYLRVSILSFYNFNNSFGPQQVTDQLLKYRSEGYNYIYLLSIENNPAAVQAMLKELHSLSKQFTSITIKKNQSVHLDGYIRKTICIEFYQQNPRNPIAS